MTNKRKKKKIFYLIICCLLLNSGRSLKSLLAETKRRIRLVTNYILTSICHILGSKSGKRSRQELLVPQGSSRKCQEMPTVSKMLSLQVICHTSMFGDPGNTMYLSDNGERRASSAFKYLLLVAKGRKPRQKIPGPPGWGLGMEPITPFRKRKVITETDKGHSVECVGYYQGARSAGCCLTSDDSIMRMDSSMRNAGESRKETCMRMRASTHPEKTRRVRCWNVRTVYSTGKTAGLTDRKDCREMATYKVEILGISTCRWAGSGQVRTQTGEKIIFAGKNDNRYQSRVAIVMSKEAFRALESWHPVSDRVISARFNSKHIK